MSALGVIEARTLRGGDIREAEVHLSPSNVSTLEHITESKHLNVDFERVLFKS